MLDKGIITEKQISGNDRADELAKSGAAEHQVDEKVLLAQEHRTNITMTYQNMMVQIWSSFFDEYVNQKGKSAKQDIICDALCSPNLVQESGDYDDDDYRMRFGFLRLF